MKLPTKTSLRLSPIHSQHLIESHIWQQITSVCYASRICHYLKPDSPSCPFLELVPEHARTGWSPPAHHMLLREDWYLRRFLGESATGKMREQPWQTMPHRRVVPQPVVRVLPTRRELARYYVREWRAMGKRMKDVAQWLVRRRNRRRMGRRIAVDRMHGVI
jgi:hypothetical protein